MLADSLNDKTNITSLILKTNETGSKGAIAILKALRVHTAFIPLNPFFLSRSPVRICAFLSFYEQFELRSAHDAEQPTLYVNQLARQPH